MLKIFLFVLGVVEVSRAFNSNNEVSWKPSVEKCKSRPKEFSISGKNYFFSGNLNELRGKEVSWQQAREYCRNYCMDTISIETQKEFEMVKKTLEDYSVHYIWTSGKICDYKDCFKVGEFQPLINGWFWTHSNVKIPRTDRNPPNWSFNPWSTTGFMKIPQPDNAEFYVNRKNESCLGVLHNVYDDGIKFHDVACYHKKPFFCEDSPELLKLVNII
jgi:hypothetical protein